jgi:hypothetical protein
MQSGRSEPISPGKKSTSLVPDSHRFSRMNRHAARHFLHTLAVLLPPSFYRASTSLSLVYIKYRTVDIHAFFKSAIARTPPGP